MKIPIIGGSSGGFDADVVDTYTQNWYKSPSPDGHNQNVLMPSPGTGDSVQSLSAAPNAGTGCRGAITVNNVPYFVFGDSFYKNQTIKHSGVLNNSANNPIDMATNGRPTNNGHILVAGASPYVYSIEYETMWKLDGTNTYNTSGTADTDNLNSLTDSTANFVEGTTHELGMTVHNKTDNTWAFITATPTTTRLTLSADIFPDGTDDYEIAASYNGNSTGAVAGVPDTGVTIEFLDGYFITASGQQIYISAQHDATRWDALDFASFEKDDGDIQAIKALNGELWVIGEYSTSVWRNTGNVDFPFAPIKAADIDYGTNYPNTVQRVQDNIIWLANTKEGGQHFVKTQGYNVTVISTPQISALFNVEIPITTSGSTYGIRSMAYGIGNFYHYIVTAYLTNVHHVETQYKTKKHKTFAYDLLTGEWHNLVSVSDSTGDYWQGGAITSYSIGNQNYFPIGAIDENGIYYLSPMATQMFGNSIVRKRRSKVFHAEGRSVRHHAVELNAAEHSLFPQIYGQSSTANLLFTNDITTDASPVNDVTQVVGIDDGNTETVSSATTKIITTNANPTSFEPGDYVKLVDANGALYYPATGISMRYRDSGGSWSTKKYRAPDSLKSRIIWRKLGKSFEREYEFEVTDAVIRPIIIDAYLYADTSDEELK